MVGVRGGLGGGDRRDEMALVEEGYLKFHVIDYQGDKNSILASIRCLRVVLEE